MCVLWCMCLRVCLHVCMLVGHSLLRIMTKRTLAMVKHRLGGEKVSSREWPLVSLRKDLLPNQGLKTTEKIAEWLRRHWPGSSDPPSFWAFCTVTCYQGRASRGQSKMEQLWDGLMTRPLLSAPCPWHQRCLSCFCYFWWEDGGKQMNVLC